MFAIETCVVAPCDNEEPRLGELHRRVGRALDHIDKTYGFVMALPSRCLELFSVVAWLRGSTIVGWTSLVDDEVGQGS
jgi:hypothetical protein